MLNLILSQPVRLQQGSTPAADVPFADSLSRIRFKILTHIVIWNLWRSFKVNLRCNFVSQLPTKQITFVSRDKLSELKKSRLKAMHFDRQLSKNSKSYKANLSLPARAFTFHSTLCHIKFSIWHHCNERGDERELQLLSPSHTRGILISAPSSCSQRLDGKAWLWNITEPPCLPKQTAELCQKGDWPQCRETTGQHAAVQESVSLVSVCRQKLQLVSTKWLYML